MDGFIYGAYMPANQKRKGKWGIEEEAYTNKMIEAFNTGTLALSDAHRSGQLTLRAYLAEKLNCDPMRITKKFTGALCLGKRVYHKGSGLHGHVPTDDEVKATTKELLELEAKFKEKLDYNDRKKREYANKVDLLQLQASGIPIAQALQSFEEMESSTSRDTLHLNQQVFQQQFWSHLGIGGDGVDKSTHVEACKAAHAAYKNYVMQHRKSANATDDDGDHFAFSSSSSSSSSAESGGAAGGGTDGPSSSGAAVRDGRGLSLAGWTDIDRKITVMEMAARNRAHSRTGGMSSMSRSDSVEGGTSTESTSIKGGSTDSNNEDDSGGANSDSAESDSNEDRSDRREGIEPPSKRVKADTHTAATAAASALLGLGQKN